MIPILNLYRRKQGGKIMDRDFNRDELFWQYYEKWIEVYKKGAVREITLNKYMMTLSWLKKLAPDLVVSDLNRLKEQSWMLWMKV